MRLNKYIALATGISRRAADAAIAEGRVRINGQRAGTGIQVEPGDTVKLDGKVLSVAVQKITIMLNKPPGYVCSRNGQGSKTVYDLLPAEYHNLKPVGRLDKDSSGLLLLTNDGVLANELTHPRYGKTKLYEVRLDTPLAPLHHQIITGDGVTLEDGASSFQLEKLNGRGTGWRVTMQEGRNRQIRRTFAALGYEVTRLHRTHFGAYSLGELPSGKTQPV